MVTFSKKAGTTFRDELKKSGNGSGDYIRTLKDGKDLRVRFLEEPEQFTAYREHYHDTLNYFPCTQEPSCPGCTSDNERTQRSSKRWAANVLDVKEGRVIAVKLPFDLMERVVMKYERNGGTLLDRDFTLIRQGKGMHDTTYEVESEDRVPMDLDRYEKIDIEKLLAATFEEKFGVDNDNPPY